ncbi:hypothetical protein B0H21DRAFT_835315 [Amylocystis lapponica]|nr:hypothetical protein B0H21DRAFT_835315 [Amylocystis lapponica]
MHTRSSSSSTADYIPLSQFPFRTRKPIDYANTYCLRRRVILAAIFASSLFTLYVFLNRTLGDLAEDVDEFDDDPIHPAVAFHASYLPFKVLSSIPSPDDTPLRPIADLPTSCLEDYFALGEPCYGSNVTRLDLLWTWVNGSDPLGVQAQQDAIDAYEPDDPYRPVSTKTSARLYRDHDELRHSMRSVLLNFRPHARHFRLLTADYPVPSTDPDLAFSTEDGWRLGQVPQWLDLSRQTARGTWRDGDVELSLTHHAEIFSPYEGTNFNSLAIESQLGHLEGISENFVYMNDDLYFLSPVTATTFYTSAYGLVLHMQPNLLVSPLKPPRGIKGEWRSMGESNYLLSQRFGSRHRPYIVHEAKTVSRALLGELEAHWPDAFAASATHPFRETRIGTGDVNTLFLHAHFVVERAREALLWAWAVARVGAPDDAWGAREARAAWEALGGVWGEDTLEVRAAYRATLEPERVERALGLSGHDGVGRTTYEFSSLDGYAYVGLGTNGLKHFHSLQADEDADRPYCEIEYATCFGEPGESGSASEVFKHIAFARLECGDCVITALVRASGPLGVSAFLPPADRVLGTLAGRAPAPAPQPAPAPAPAHLPVTADWRNGSFALRDVMSRAPGAERSVRAWTRALLLRYRYVLGNTPALFERVQSPRQAAEVLQRIEAHPEVALLCVNDDVGSDHARVAGMLREWQEHRWGAPAAWEKMP